MSRTKRQILFIQGGGKDVHDEWDNKLVESLRRELGAEYDLHYPRMPNEEDPRYASWKPAIEKELEALDDGAIVVGHSIGATMLANVLAKREKRELGALILISAPFVGEGGWPSDELKSTTNLGEMLPKDVPIHIFHGLADDEVPPQHADLYERAIPQAVMHRIAGRDHQFNNDLKDVAAEIMKSDGPRPRQ
jgi:predicted alpha/beta hydrolase family esterase